MAKKKKIRADFRKNRAPRARQSDLTRRFRAESDSLDDAAREERVSGKGEVTRKRTIIEGEVEGADSGESTSLVGGRVLQVGGLYSQVAADDGVVYRCATRRVLKTLATDERHVVTAGDLVQIRRSGIDEGIIQRIEPRTNVLCRTSKGRQQLLAANIDRVLIVASAAEPALKPNLIDRLLVTAERDGIEPLLVINKIDLVEPAELQPLVGVYSQMGYEVHLVSATTGQGIWRLRQALDRRASCVAGQSGVGKSSLLNSIEPGLALRVSAVSEENQKGRHTTTSAMLLPLASGGWVVDTPGIRQFQLWDLTGAEIAGLYRDLRPLVSHCRFPDCTHTHEAGCRVKDAVADDLLDARRYESFCHLQAGDYT